MIKMSGKPLTLKLLLPQAIDNLKSDKHYEVTIKHMSKRSIEQNKMLWKNIQIIAKETGSQNMDVYCDLLVDADVKSEIVATVGEMQTAMKDCFRAIKFLNTNEGYYVYQAFIGSSKMTVKECSELLEKTFDILETLGVNYQTPDWS